jgi:hypothetical protein
MYGPELWRPDEGGDWSYWDLWFAVLCVHDHGGDWDGFDAALTKIRGDGGEAKWSHLLDLRERLAAAGSTPSNWWGTPSRRRDWSPALEPGCSSSACRCAT